MLWRGGDQSNSEHCIDHAGTLNCDKGQKGGIVAFKENMSTPSWGIDQCETLQAENHHAIAFTQNARSEVRQIGGDGLLAGALSAGSGMNQTNYLAMAFAQNQLGEVRTNREVMGTVNTNQNASGRNTPMVMQAAGVDFQNCGGTGDLCGTIMGEAQKKGGQAGHGVVASMSVRRLTPRECERLQGFPDDYTLVTYRNKPAADGPRYKALGNSMAVPVMRWIGERIASVDSLDGAP